MRLLWSGIEIADFIANLEQHCLLFPDLSEDLGVGFVRRFLVGFHRENRVVILMSMGAVQLIRCLLQTRRQRSDQLLLLQELCLKLFDLIERCHRILGVVLLMR